LLLCLVGTPASAEERFALLIGSNIGWANDRPLRYAESDAERMRQVLVELGGFPPDRVYLLRDPSTEQVRARLQSLGDTLRGLGRDSLILFYYSGHADERHLHLRGAPLPLSELREALGSLPATVRLGVLDACRSGAIVAAKGVEARPGFEVEVVDALKVRGLALLTSSGADELSQEVRALAGSVFTHHLISGLRGAGDSNDDGVVTLAEAWRYAFLGTEADTAPTPVPHRPAFGFELEGQGEPVLTRPRVATSRLVLPADQGVRYVVVDEPEVRLVAEGRTRPEGPLVLALAPGRYRVKRVRATQLDVAEVTLEPGARVEAAALNYASRPLAAGLLKGRPDELDAGAQQEWKRGEALRLLAAGEAGVALSLFDALLERDPKDSASLRGKARALVRLAELYRRVGDQKRELRSLREAVRAEPSLAKDPSFADGYRRLGTLAHALETPAPPVGERTDSDSRLSGYRLGVGLDLVGPRGMLAVNGTAVFWDRLFTHVSVDLIGPGLGLGLQFTLKKSLWSPYIGVGAHLPLASLGLPMRQDFVLEMAFGKSSYQKLWGKSVYAETGVQYLSHPGFSLSFGLELMSSERVPDGSHGVALMLQGGAAWYFRFPR
jgi:tetratricopeptide (TPR) repeat protein